MMAAKSLSPESLDYIASVMRSPKEDTRNRLTAAALILDRGYGKPKEHVTADVVHRFAEVPEVMEREAWLRTRGGMLPDVIEAKAIPAPEPAKADPPPKDRKLN